ncbi:hypothetical protein I7I48_01941 [Histoplasma ohiense]|nr:hypothetical protein I7I48_01941 [Histoplasma ohiense (nom. inval.)]
MINVHGVAGQKPGLKPSRNNPGRQQILGAPRIAESSIYLFDFACDPHSTWRPALLPTSCGALAHVP